MKRIAIVVVGIALMATACSSDDETVDATPEVVVLDDAEASDPESVDPESVDPESVDAESVDAADPAGTGDTADAADTANAAGAVGASDEEQALAFAQCMRDNGVNLADPTVGADGSVNLTPPDDPGVSDDEAQAAFDTCSDLLDGASFLPDDDQRSEIEDQLLAVAQCFRDQGLDVDDPDLSNFAPGAGNGVFGENFDPADPANQPYIDACSHLFTGFTPPGGR